MKRLLCLFTLLFIISSFALSAVKYVHRYNKITKTWTSYPFISIHDIQFDPLDSLKKADSIQTTNPAEWTLQASSRAHNYINTAATTSYGDTVTVVGEVIIPPKIIGYTAQGFTAVLYDTGVGNAPWSGLIIRCNSPTDTLQNISDGFLSIEQGDIVMMTGLLAEYAAPPGTEMPTLTQFQPIAGYSIDVLNPLAKAPLPPVIMKGDSIDQFYKGAYVSTGPFHVQYSTGERYEAMYVGFTNLTIVGYTNVGGRNAIQMVDVNGNTLVMHDASRWFTVTGAWKDPSSHWVLPPTGATIDTIRGIMLQINGSSRNFGYVIAPMFPGDVQFGVGKPLITNAKRTPNYIQTEQLFNISAQVHVNTTGGGFKIGHVYCLMSTGIGQPFQSTEMTIVDTGQTYGASYLDLPNNTFVRYFIQAYDTAGNHSTLAYQNVNNTGVIQYGTDTSVAMFNFTVTNHAPTIHDIQYTPYSIGISPYLGARVTLGGIVTADSTIMAASTHNSIYGTQAYYIQSGNQPWSGILVYHVTGDTSLGSVRLGDSISVTGTINEYGYITQIQVLNTATVINHNNPIPAPITVPTSTFAVGNPNGEQYESMLVRVVNTTIGSLVPVSSDPELYSVNDGSGALLVDIDGKNTYSTIAADSTIGRTTIIFAQEPIDTLTGIIYFNGNSQWSICPRTDADFSAGYHLGYSSGWNIVSVGRTQTPSQGGYNVTRLFPNATSNAFKFAGSYVTDTALWPGIGYWLKLPANKIFRQTGAPILLDTSFVTRGWNLIGSIGDSISVSSITTIPPVNGLSNFFGYSKTGYTASSELQPSYGYWVKTDSDGALIMSATGFEKKTPGVVDLNQFNSITFSDASGGAQTLYFGTDPDRKVNLKKYEMPPASMVGILDARFTSNRLLETYPLDVATAKKFGIALQNISGPVTVKWNIVSGDTKEYTITDLSGNKLITVHGKGDVVLDKPAQTVYLTVSNSGNMPKEFSLSQNYPNPFNPTTRFVVAMPQAAHLQVAIFNILGQKVATVVDETREAGYHTIEWNSTTNTGLVASSGVYFIRVTAGDFNSVKKIVLMK